MLPPSAEGAEAISVGLRYKIESDILKEPRPIRVHVPTGVQPDDRFPTAYILDGEEDFALAVAILQTLYRAGRVPPMIVVGIDNLHRIYDLTTLDTDYNGPESGGADHFFEFNHADFAFTHLLKFLIRTMFSLLALETAPATFARMYLLATDIPKFGFAFFQTVSSV